MRVRVPAPILGLMHVCASRWKKPCAPDTLKEHALAPMTETRIDGRPVSIEPGAKTIIRFSGGKGGPSEAGRWEFWTLMGPAGAVVTRCQEGADPGERFSQMKAQRVNETPWKKSRFADQLHPATIDELEGWMNTHPDFVPHAKSGELGGAKVRVVRNGGRYGVIPDAPLLRPSTPSRIVARFWGMAP